MLSMRQTSIKSDRVAELLDELVAATGESKVEAVEKALEDRLRSQRRDSETERLVVWLENSVWSKLPAGVRGAAPSREEQDELLGYDE